MYTVHDKSSVCNHTELKRLQDEVIGHRVPASGSFTHVCLWFLVCNTLYLHFVLKDYHRGWLDGKHSWSIHCSCSSGRYSDSSSSSRCNTVTLWLLAGKSITGVPYLVCLEWDVKPHSFSLLWYCVNDTPSCACVCDIQMTELLTQLHKSTTASRQFTATVTSKLSTSQ